MRVLHVLNYAWPVIDGYTVRSIGLISAQKRHLGLAVDIAVSPFAPFTTAADPSFRTAEWGPEHQVNLGRQPGVPSRWERPGIGLSPTTSARFRHELADLVVGLRPDLIHAHHPHYIGSAAMRVAKAHRLPFVYELRCINGDYDREASDPYRRLRGRWQNLLEHALCRQASAIVTISSGLKDRLVGAGAAPERVHIVRNSVDPGLFAPAEPLRERTDTLRVGYATTFETMENLEGVVRAAAIAAPKLVAMGRKLEMVLAGTGRDWTRIDALVRSLGLEALVELAGFVPYRAMPDFYRDLDLFLIPRKAAPVSQDTTPLKPLEAMACGLPLLCSDLPAMRELLSGRDDVRFVGSDPQALADGLLAFARTPWRGGGVLAERNWSSEIRRYEAIYAAAMTAGPPRWRPSTNGVRSALPVVRRG